MLFSVPYVWEVIMTEERRLMAAGMPLDEAISICHALRRERYELPEFIRRRENEHLQQLEEKHEWLLTV